MKQDKLYSQSKALWHVDAINDLRNDKVIVPKHIQLIISDLCNQDCSFCAYRASNGNSATNIFRGEGGKKNPNRKIPLDKCYEILEDAAEAGVQAVQFTGGGEPTVHPDYKKIFRRALDLGLKCGLVTNLTRVCDEMLDFEWVRVSIDAGDEHTYERIRKHKGWDRVHGNLEWLAENRKSDLVLGYGFVVTPGNYSGVSTAAGRAYHCGADYIRYSAVFSSDGLGLYEPGLLDIIQRRCAEEEQRYSGVDGFSVYNLFDDRIHDLDQGKPDYDRCWYQQFTVYIGGNQQIYRCCTTSYQPIGHIGDLTEMRFRDWLVSEERADHMKNFLASSCKMCQFNGQNRAIDGAVRERPRHVEFV